MVRGRCSNPQSSSSSLMPFRGSPFLCRWITRGALFGLLTTESMLVSTFNIKYSFKIIYCSKNTLQFLHNCIPNVVQRWYILCIFTGEISPNKCSAGHNSQVNLYNVEGQHKIFLKSVCLLFKNRTLSVKYLFYLSLSCMNSSFKPLYFQIQYYFSALFEPGKSMLKCFQLKLSAQLWALWRAQLWLDHGKKGCSETSFMEIFGDNGKLCQIPSSFPYVSLLRKHTVWRFFYWRIFTVHTIFG